MCFQSRNWELFETCDRRESQTIIDHINSVWFMILLSLAVCSWRRLNIINVLRTKSRTRSYRGTSAESLLFARDTFDPTKLGKQPSASDEKRPAADGDRRGEAEKTPPTWGRRFGKQVNNNKHERGIDARGSRRCGSVAKETRGRTEGRRKRRQAAGEGFGIVSRRSPVHGPRRESRGEGELFWSASLPHRSQAATMENNGLTSRLVTSRENMAAGADTPQIRESHVNDQCFFITNNYYLIIRLKIFNCRIRQSDSVTFHWLRCSQIIQEWLNMELTIHHNKSEYIYIASQKLL